MSSVGRAEGCECQGRKEKCDVTMEGREKQAEISLSSLVTSGNYYRFFNP